MQLSYSKYNDKDGTHIFKEITTTDNHINNKITQLLSKANIFIGLRLIQIYKWIYKCL